MTSIYCDDPESDNAFIQSQVDDGDYILMEEDYWLVIPIVT